MTEGYSVVIWKDNLFGNHFPIIRISGKLVKSGTFMISEMRYFKAFSVIRCVVDLRYSHIDIAGQAEVLCIH